jgi:uncharacterized OB-fold protein
VSLPTRCVWCGHLIEIGRLLCPDCRREQIRRQVGLERPPKVVAHVTYDAPPPPEPPPCA